MPKVGNLVPLNLRDLIDRSAENSKGAKTPENSKDFGDTISDFIDAVNSTQKESAEKVTEVIQGKSENLHEAMAFLEESRLSFQLMLEIRNKLLESFKELERMQV